MVICAPLHPPFLDRTRMYSLPEVSVFMRFLRIPKLILMASSCWVFPTVWMKKNILHKLDVKQLPYHSCHTVRWTWIFNTEEKRLSSTRPTHKKRCCIFQDAYVKHRNYQSLSFRDFCILNDIHVSKLIFSLGSVSRILFSKEMKFFFPAISHVSLKK